MGANFHETIEDQPLKLPSDRSTGLVLSAAAAVGAAVLWQVDLRLAAAAASLAITLAATSLVAPASLRPLNRAWMGLAHLMGRIVNPIVMGLVYLFAIVPFGLALQMRADPLRRNAEPVDGSYWIVPEIKFGPGDMTRQF